MTPWQLSDTGESYRSESPHAFAVRDAVADAMGSPVPDRLDPEPSRRPAIAARADVPERDAANGIAAEQDASLSYADATHDDGVKHDRNDRALRRGAEIAQAAMLANHDAIARFANQHTAPVSANYGAAPSETWSRGVREAAERVAKRKAAPAWSEAERLAFLRRAQAER